MNVEAKLIEEKGRHYKKVYIPLDVARDKELFELPGDFIFVEELKTEGNIEIRLNDEDNDPVNLQVVRKIISPFSRFYLTNDAYTGGYIKLLIGGEAKFSAEGVIPVNIIVADIKPKKAELYGASALNAQEVTLDIGGYKTVEVVFNSTTELDMKIEYSFDNVHWFTYDEAIDIKFYNDVFTTGARYIRVSTPGSSAAATTDTVDIIISAKL